MAAILVILESSSSTLKLYILCTKYLIGSTDGFNVRSKSRCGGGGCWVETNCIDKVIGDWGDIIRFILYYIYWGICWMIYIFHSTLIVCFISIDFRVLADSSDVFTHHNQGSVTGNWIFFTWGQFWPLGIVIARVCMSVCVCVRQSRGFPHDNSSSVPARTTKFGKKLQNNLVYVPIVGGDWSCPSRSNWICSFTLIEYRAGVTLAIATPICNLKRNIAARCFYCSVNPLRP